MGFFDRILGAAEEPRLKRPDAPPRPVQPEDSDAERQRQQAGREAEARAREWEEGERQSREAARAAMDGWLLDPGSKVWHDSTTLYFELRGSRNCRPTPPPPAPSAADLAGAIRAEVEASDAWRDLLDARRRLAEAEEMGRDVASARASEPDARAAAIAGLEPADLLEALGRSEQRAEALAGHARRVEAVLASLRPQLADAERAVAGLAERLARDAWSQSYRPVSRQDLMAELLAAAGPILLKLAGLPHEPARCPAGEVAGLLLGEGGR